MTLPLLPVLSDTADDDTKALWLYLSRLKDQLDNFSPSQASAALDIGGLGYGPGGVLDDVTKPQATPIPDAPTGLDGTGFYRQAAIFWNLDPNPFIVGWEVQRADNSGFINSPPTQNVNTLSMANAQSFIDPGPLLDNTDYWYRVRAMTADPAKFSPYNLPGPVLVHTLPDDTGIIAKLQNASVLMQRAHMREAIIDSAHIGVAAIEEANIADGAVTHLKVADAAIESVNIKNGTIQSVDIGNAQITNALIDSVSADKITTGTLDVLVQLTNQTIKLDGINGLISIQDTQSPTPVLRVRLGLLAGGTATDYGLEIYNQAGQLMFTTTGAAGISGATSFGIKDLQVLTQKIADLAVLVGKVGPNEMTNRTIATTTAGFTRNGAVSTAYALVTGASVNFTAIAPPGGSDIEILVVTNMLVGSNTGVTNTTSGAAHIANDGRDILDRCIGAIRLVVDGTPQRYAGYSDNVQGVAAAPNLIGPCVLYFVHRAPTAGVHAYTVECSAQNAQSTVTIDVLDLRVEEIKR